MNRIKNIPELIPITFSIILVIGIIGVYAVSPKLAIIIFLAILAFIGLICSMYKFNKFFLVLLVLRSSMDIFTDVNMRFGPISLNIPSFLSIFILMGGCLYLSKNKQAVLPLISFYYGFWLLTLIPFVLLNIYNFGENGVIAIREWVRLLTIFMIFLLSYNMVNIDNAKMYFKAIMLSLIIPLAVGYYQIITRSGIIINDIHRIYGTIAHPNSYALFIVLFIGLTYWRWRKNFAKSWFILLILELIALISTVSINGAIMFILLLAIVLWSEKISYRIVMLLALVVFILTLSQNKQIQQRYERIKDINFKHNIQHEELADSISWRLFNWWNLIKLWEEKPFTGYGLQATNVINPIITPRGKPAEAHNDYIKYLLETGIVGFNLYLLFNILVLLSIFWEYKAAKNTQLKRLIFILMAMFASWQIGSLSSNFLRSTTFQFYFWAILGIALKCRRLEKNNHNGSIVGCPI